MNLVVCSLDEAEKFVCSSSWIAISVVSEGEHPKLSDKNRVGLLQFSFWDVDKVIKGRPRMMESDALRILEFVDEYWDKVETVLVHCEAGLSRYPAIAAAISKIRTGNDGGYFKTHSPNKWVYSTILKVNDSRQKV